MENEIVAPKLGIDSLKLAVKFGSSFGEQTEKAMADGKLGIEDAGGYFTVFMDNANGFPMYKNIPAEFKDIDSAEAAELVRYATEELNLENDNLEFKIEKCLQACIVIMELAVLFKKKA